jgi:hypothetical protein
MAKRLYPDVAIYTLNNKVYVVSDKLYNVSALATIQVISFSGQVLKKIEKEVQLLANQVQSIYTVEPKDY